MDSKITDPQTKHTWKHNKHANGGTASQRGSIHKIRSKGAHHHLDVRHESFQRVLVLSDDFLALLRDLKLALCTFNTSTTS